MPKRARKSLSWPPSEPGFGLFLIFQTVSEEEFCELRPNGVLGSSLTVGGRSTEEAPQPGRRAPLARLRLCGLHRLPDPDLPLGPAIVLGGTRVVGVQPFE